MRSRKGKKTTAYQTDLQFTKEKGKKTTGIKKILAVAVDLELWI